MCDIQSRPAAQSLLFGASSRCLVCQLYASRGGRGSRSQPNYCTCFLVEGRTSSRLRQLFQLSLLEKEAAFPATFPVAAFPAVAGNADFSPPRDVLKGKSEKTKIASPKNGQPKMPLLGQAWYRFELLMSLKNEENIADHPENAPQMQKI